MEKFTKWSDKATGVNPFVPINRKPMPKSLGSKALHALAGTTLVLLRLPLLVTTVGGLGLVSIFLQPAVMVILGGGLAVASHQELVPSLEKSALMTPALAVMVVGLAMAVVTPLRRLVQALFLRPLLGLILMLLGVSFTEQHANLRRLGLRPPGYKPPVSRVGLTVKPGDLVISNHASPLDVLYFAHRLLFPVFTSVTRDQRDKSRKVSVSAISWARALRQACQAATPTKEAGGGSSLSLSSVVEVAMRGGQAVVLFPEMVRSNGEGVLEFEKEALEGLGSGGDATATGGTSPPVRAHIFAFSGSSAFPLPSLTVGSALGFFLRLTSQLSNPVTVTYVGAEDAPPAFPRGQGQGLGGAGGVPLSSVKKRVGGAGWGEEVRDLVAAMVGKPKLALGVEDAISFDSYWRSVSQGDAALAAKLADARGKH